MIVGAILIFKTAIGKINGDVIDLDIFCTRQLPGFYVYICIHTHTHTHTRRSRYKMQITDVYRDCYPYMYMCAYFIRLNSIITNVARYTLEIESRIALEKVAF